jgi:hypothetical protein
MECMNFESSQGIVDLADYPLNSEIVAAMREQSAGKDPNMTIFVLRQALTRRGKNLQTRDEK